MTIEHFIIELFCRVDDQIPDAKRHSQAALYPSEVMTLALLVALKGGKPSVLSMAEEQLHTSVPAIAGTHTPVSIVQLASQMDRRVDGCSFDDRCD